MQYKEIQDMKVSQIALGCMRFGGWGPQFPGASVEEFEAMIDACLSVGINFFDHADIYGGGRSESVFGEVLAKRPELREQIIIQTKCGIVPGQRYDFSKDYIINAVNGSLERLQTDYIDILLLHRPDALTDYKEVGEAFDALYESGKVRHFGVSNFNTMQMQLLQKYVKYPLLFNQLQFSIVHSPYIDAGFHVNMRDEYACDRTGDDIFNYCMLNDITVQAWSSVQASWEEGTFIDNPAYGPLNEVLQRLADKYQVTKACIAIAWILRHPSGIIPIVGTTSKAHLEEMAKATDICLERQEWYDLYLATGRPLP